jgi:hypothetical protein
MKEGIIHIRQKRFPKCVSKRCLIFQVCSFSFQNNTCLVADNKKGQCFLESSTGLSIGLVSSTVPRFIPTPVGNKYNALNDQCQAFFNLFLL